MTEQPSVFEVQLLIKFKAAHSKPKRRKLFLAKCYGYECFARSPRRQRGRARSNVFCCEKSVLYVKAKILIVLRGSKIPEHNLDGDTPSIAYPRVPKWVTEWAPAGELLVKILPGEVSCDVIEI